MTRLLAWTFLFLLAPSVAVAQKIRPIPPIVLDVRGAIAMLKQSTDTAASLDLTAAQLPARGLGLGGGLHVYPIRRGGFALGLGGELLLARAKSQPKDGQGQPLGFEVARRLQSLSGQLSFNFGHRDGWSYLSGGMGPVAFDSYIAGLTPDGLRPMTLNYGGGARWFNTDHVAFCFDIRIYATKPANATLIVGARRRQNVMVISAGISIR